MKEPVFYNDQHLTYQELLDYHQGNLLNSEMHRLELHLVDCALCREALEGLEHIEPAELEKYLATVRLKTKPAGKLPPARTLLAAAAGLLLIGVIGWLVLFYGGRQAEDTQQLAAHEEQIPQQQKVPEPAPATIDSLPATDTLQQNIPVAAPTLAAAPTNDNQAGSSEPAGVPPAEEEVSLAGNADTISGLTPDSTALLAEAVPAEIPDTTTQMPAAQPAVPAEARKMAAESSDSAVRITSVADEEALVSRALAEQESYRPAAPGRSPKAWQRYLRRNLRYPQQALDNNITGEVKLQVSVSADGKPGTINVLQSLGYGCDREAIRLVREGPDWQPALRNGTPVADTLVIAIPFER